MRKPFAVPITLCILLLLSACDNPKNNNLVKIPTDAHSSAVTSSSGQIHSSSNYQTANQLEIGLTDKWHNVFEGTIGKQKIYMDIFRDGNNLTAYYIDNDSNNEHMYSGSINEYTMTLSSSDTHETMTGNLKDLYASNIITGEMTLNSGKIVPVNLNIDHANAGPALKDRYGDRFNSQEVESFVSRLKSAILSSDKQAVSNMIQYPITVYQNNREKAKINNAQQFVKYYSDIINKNLYDCISTAYTKFMFSNYNGVMFGSGNYNVWIQESQNGKLSIIGINN